MLRGDHLDDVRCHKDTSAANQMKKKIPCALGAWGANMAGMMSIVAIDIAGPENCMWSRWSSP